MLTEVEDSADTGTGHLPEQLFSCPPRGPLSADNGRLQLNRHLLCARHSVYLGSQGWESMVGSLHSSVHWLHLGTVLDKITNGQVAQGPTFTSGS